MRSVVAAIVTVTFAGVSADALGQAAQYGSLSYPAAGNIQLDEGTVELWVVSGFDSDQERTDTSSFGTFFNLVFPEQNWHYVVSFLTWGHSLAMVGYTVPAHSYVWAGTLHWKPGEAHHVAVTWSGRKRTVLVDGQYEFQGNKGKCVSLDVIVEGWIHGDMTTAQIVFGRGHSQYTLDELRISSIARSVDEIRLQMTSAPTADAHTLLLDHCDGGPAEVVARFSGETGGRLDGGYQVVDSKFGKAIQLWKP